MAYSVQSDIWSLGVIFYEMMIGLRPFEGETYEITLQNVLNDPPKIPMYFSKDLIDLHKALLKKEPNQRPSLAEVLQNRVL